MEKHLEERRAQLSIEMGFYNCDCGWSGKGLSYADEKGRSDVNRHRPYEPGQGHCPRCGRPFVGCFK